ncbi:MAG TPA: radical SAM protein [Candidatus Eisenbacteria bacterium]|nr:radical SAM protein [Candidatus Eisenbacteria bacterium]
MQDPALETLGRSDVPVPGRPVRITLRRLTSLWFQVTGFLCNLECKHCLVDSSPRNNTMPFLDRTTVQSYLAEAESMGVKEIYFTGGEPFLHPELAALIEDALAVAPTTALTNGTLITEAIAGTLRKLSDNSKYSLEIRVSMDHPEASENDRVRGPGSHAKALRAVRRLQEAGLLPIVTATEFAMSGDTSIHEAFVAMLRREGIRYPRLKLLPVFHTGKLEDPASGSVVTEAMMSGIEPGFLQCSETRVVTTQGIYACPILVGKREGFLYEGSLRRSSSVRLAHHACRTCYETGMSCSNR